MPAEIDIDALNKVLQNLEQMRLNIGKKLKTASLDSRFTGSKKEVYLDLLTFEKFWNLNKHLELLLTYEFTHQQPQGRFTSFKKNYSMKKVVLISHWFKNIIKFCRSFTNYHHLRNLLA